MGTAAHFSSRKLLWRKMRHAGLLYTAGQVIDMVVPRRVFCVECFMIFECDLAADAPNVLGDHETRWATDDDLSALAETGRFRARIPQLLAAGARAAVLVHHGMTVACLWTSTGRHDQDDWLTFRLHPLEAWTVTIWVRPDFRGHGHHGQLWAFGTAALAAEGYKRILGHINVLNRSSIRAFAKAGARPVRWVFTLRLLGWTLVRWAGRTHIGRWNEHVRYELWPGTRPHRRLGD